MKKFLLATALCAALFGAGFEANGQKGGFNGPVANSANTVAAALKAPDDSMVSLRGKITRQLGHEKYEFVDNTGSIVIEIDDDKWYGISVSPNDEIEIYGEVDYKALRNNEVEVKSLKKLN